jgi:hypothetical protein
MRVVKTALGVPRIDFYLQKTALTTLGMFLLGFLVSPAVMPRLSVPPSERTSVFIDQQGRRSSQAKLAVTKTRAKPPKPPTNGAPGILQLANPITACSGFNPTFTAMPTMMKATMVMTLRDESQYSACL